MHWKDDQIQAWLDGELPAPESARLHQHLANCPTCSRRADQLQQAALLTRQSLDCQPPSAHFARSAPAALQRLQDRGKEKTMKKIYTRPAFIATMLVAVLAVAMIFPPAQALANDFLGLFRVQQVKVLSIDDAQLQALDDTMQANQSAIEDIFSSSVTQVQGGEMQSAANLSEATALAGFSPRYLTDEAISTIEVSANQVYELTINSAQWNALFAALGESDTLFPAELDGQIIRIEMPAAITARLTTCTDPDDPTTCPQVVEMPSPTVSTPDGLDAPKLAEAALRILGMPAAEAHEYAQSTDWASTLVLPIPVGEGVTAQEVELGGVQATLLTHETSGTYTLLWPQDGLLISIFGQGDGQMASDMAHTLLP
jgi:hypothetical protein